MGCLKFDPSTLMDLSNALNPKEFNRQGHMMIDFIADYYENMEKYPVLSQVEPGYLRKHLPESAHDNPEAIETILQDVQDHIVSGLTHWQSPNFFAYFASNVSIGGFLGEMLTTGFNVVGFNWVSSPAATELESIVMDWLGNMLGLPKFFHFSVSGGGVLHGSTCEAIVCTMAAARGSNACLNWKRQHRGSLLFMGWIKPIAPFKKLPKSLESTRRIFGPSRQENQHNLHYHLTN